MRNLVAANVENPPIHIRHSELERLNTESYYRSVCPACLQGSLLMYRDLQTCKLMKKDRCTLCGQKFVYDDIEEIELWHT